MVYNGSIFMRRSTLVSCRDPFKKDMVSVDYDLDSEEEWMEMNCDDLDNEQLMLEEDGENGDAQDLKDEGFIVPDD